MDNPRSVNEINALAADVREMSITSKIGRWADRPPYLGADGADRVAGVPRIVSVGSDPTVAGFGWMGLAVHPDMAEPLNSLRVRPPCRR